MNTTAGIKLPIRHQATTLRRAIRCGDFVLFDNTDAWWRRNKQLNGAMN